MYRALFGARNAASKCAQILQNDGTLELAVQTGQERKSDVLAEGSRRPGVRQWPEAFTLNSCPEMQPLPAHLCVIRVIKVIKSFGFASQLCCQLAEWPWVSTWLLEPR